MPENLEGRLEQYFDRLWPICRSILGPGYRESLDILHEIMPMERLRFASGTEVFDWAIPDEWVARDAYLIDPLGNKRASLTQNNLHLMGYSIPFRGKLTLEELRPHLYSLPQQPNATPYLTTYYQKRWGFCLTDHELKSLPAGTYEVVVDTEIKPGHLEIGEVVLPGQSQEEILFSTYLCHPSMANNELSGPLVASFLYERIAALKNRRYTYRIAIMPETIGSLAYLSLRGEHFLRSLKAGYVLTCVGDPGVFTHKSSRAGQTLSDRVARAVVGETADHRFLDFDPADGADDRQYCSPGFNLPVSTLCRTIYGQFAEYHTSLDNKNFIRFSALRQSIDLVEKIVRVLEGNFAYRSTQPFGEPQLGRRGLYPTLGSQKAKAQRIRSIRWILNMADGSHDLCAIAERGRIPVLELLEAAQDLMKAGLIAIGPKSDEVPRSESRISFQ